MTYDKQDQRATPGRTSAAGTIYEEPTPKNKWLIIIAIIAAVAIVVTIFNL